jgi:hypothetical protein
MLATKASKNTFVYPLVGYGLYAVLSMTNQNITIRKEGTGEILRTYDDTNGIGNIYFANVTFEHFIEDAREMYLQLICKN